MSANATSGENERVLGQIMKRFDMGPSLAVCIAAMISGAVAHAEPGTLSVTGVGQFSCGQFIASIGKRPPGKMVVMPTRDGDFVSENAEYQQWLMGFVTGFNAAHLGEQEQQVEIDLAGTDLWMRNWCKQHPTKMVFDGAWAFIHEMQTNAAASRR